MVGNRILVLAPHTDDGELGVGASLAKWVSEGREVKYIAFSDCASSLPPDLPADTLVSECRKATATLGIRDVSILDFPVRRFSEKRQAVLDKLISIRNEWGPETVLIPAASDIHQDHQVIHQEALRAFKGGNLLGYELPWNNPSFSPTCFVGLTQKEVQKKWSALAHYASQSNRAYMSEDFVLSLARVRGVQCGHPLAEAFEIYRLLL
jgi:LmbE family N-acetylglucosaminyl deacetylase